MNIDKFIQDGQDPKVTDKIHHKIVSMLLSGEFIQYISLQKKPAVTLLPDSITISNKRIFLCEFTKLGMATNFEIFFWDQLKDVTFKEEFFGAKITVIPQEGENLTVDYIPKVQAKKLHQLIKNALESRTDDTHINPAPATAPQEPQQTTVIVETPLPKSTREVPKPSPAPVKPSESAKQKEAEAVLQPDTPMPLDTALAQKIKKLESLYHRQLITQAEYKNKKSELLSQH